MLFLAIVLDEVTILLVIVPLLVPIAQGLDIDLVHFGIVVVLNMMVGLTLPPHGLLLFVMSGLTGTPLAEIFRETPPFIIAMLAIVVLVTFFPAGMEGFFDRLASMTEFDLDTFRVAAAEHGMEVVGPPLGESDPL